MLYGLLVSLFVLLCFMLILIILVQKGKSSMGLGGLGGGTQMLFGGSGGQDLFQKVTWVMVAIFMSGSLILSLMKSSSVHTTSYSYKPRGAQPMQQAPIEEQAAAQLPESAPFTTAGAAGTTEQAPLAVATHEAASTQQEAEKQPAA